MVSKSFETYCDFFSKFPQIIELLYIFINFFYGFFFLIKHKRYIDIQIVFIRTCVDVTGVTIINKTGD